MFGLYLIGQEIWTGKLGLNPAKGDKAKKRKQNPSLHINVLLYNENCYK